MKTSLRERKQTCLICQNLMLAILLKLNSKRSYPSKEKLRKGKLSSHSSQSCKLLGH